MTETGASVSGFWDPLFLMKLEVGPNIAARLRRDPFQISQRHEGFLAFQAMAPRHVPGRRTANLEQSTPWAIGRDSELESFWDSARRPRGGARPPLSRERRASFAAHQRPAEGVRLAPGPTGTSVGSWVRAMRRHFPGGKPGLVCRRSGCAWGRRSGCETRRG